jgi:hypothetical protein
MGKLRGCRHWLPLTIVGAAAMIALVAGGLAMAAGQRATVRSSEVPSGNGETAGRTSRPHPSPSPRPVASSSTGQSLPTTSPPTRASATPAAGSRRVALPPVNGQFDYQIGGAYPPAAARAIVDRDRSAEPVPGKYNVCYINTFQTQADEAAFWKARHSDLLLRTRQGNLVGDPDWPGEYLLDTSTASRRAAIAAIVGAWIDRCAKAGYQAVEPDNLDSWTRSEGLLTAADNLALAARLVSRAHANGLAIAQKNAAGLGDTGKTVAGFDFAIAEECQVYAECGAYTRPYGRHVIEIEYSDSGRSAFAEACAARGHTISVVLRDRDVVPAGRSGYDQEHCP